MPVHIPLESLEAERADFGRLMSAVARIGAAREQELLDEEWLHEVVCSVGLGILHPPEVIYADMGHLVNASHQGITQYPIEFVRWLLLLAPHRPRTYLEIGCYNGGTACLAAAYLSRFHPEFHATTIDLWPWFLFYQEARARLPLTYEIGKPSYAFADRTFEAVFIDGDHSFEWCWADYQNVGRNARICGIHDINNQSFVDDYPLGGCCGVWEWIKKTEGGEGIEFHEFLDHPSDNIFGIGVRVRTGK